MSTSADQDGPRVEITQTIEVRTRVGLDAFFANLSDQQQHDYWNTNLAEYGFEVEWERPVAYLTALAVEGLDVLTPGLGASSWTTVDIPDVRYRIRRDGGDDGGSRRWTEDDFAMLAQAAPWLDPAAGPSEAELARMLGPNDVPLF